MERETRTITTPLGHTVAVKTFFTQGERSAVQRILAGDKNANAEAGGDYKVSDLLDAQQKAMEIAVVSLDSDTQNPVERITNTLPASEYDAVVAEVLPLIKGLPTAK